MTNKKSITLLHLSDIQFGINHRFELKDISDKNFDLNNIFDRLTIDINKLNNEYNIHPDIVIVTGDIVERGQKSEFDNAVKFFNDLSIFLKIDKSNIIIVPGNHDINRKACEAYFAECESDEVEPKLPYEPKWKHFKNFCTEFYGEKSDYFKNGIYYKCFEYDSLKISVANINSTIKESHRGEDHYGWVGEVQAQELADKLNIRKNENWFNIAAIHHNVIRGEVDDDDNLKDADMLCKKLYNNIDLLLHGHTHRGNIHWWNQSLPVIGTGSAGVIKNSRPEEVPNQYQIIKITRDGIVRYCRAFAPEEGWIPDARVGVNGVDEQLIRFRNIKSAFPDVLEAEEEKLKSNSSHSISIQSNDSTEQVVVNYKPYSKLPIKQNCDLPPVVDVWVGREKELASLLSTNNGIVAITGIGGQGKSAIAAKCLEKWKIDFPEGFWDWRDCREEGDRFHTQLIMQIERVTDGIIGGEELSGASTHDLVKYFFDKIEKRNCLLVFDNVDQYVNINDNKFTSDVSIFINEALNRHHNALIILTCRPRITYPNIRFSEVFLNGISFEETLDLFKKRGVDIHKSGILNTLNEVYTYTEGHPLWLNLLAIQISRNENSFDGILNELRKGEADNRARSMLRPIWDKLNSPQQDVLRCMAEIPRPMDTVQIHTCLGNRIKNFNRFKKAFKSIQGLSLIIECKTDSDSKYDLHPLVRSFIRTEYATTKERLPYINPIVCYLKQLMIGFNLNINSETSFDKLRICSEKAELEIECNQMMEAVKSLGCVASRLLATGCSEELFRVGKRIIDDFCIDPAQYKNIKEFDELFHLIIEALIEFGSESVARHYLKYYENYVENGTSLYIGFCDLMTWVEWHLKNFEEAVTWGEKGKKLKEKSSVDTSYDCNHNLALALRDSGQHEEALKYFLFGNSLESIISGEKIIEREGPFWGNIARCLIFQDQYESAIYCLVKSSKLLEKDESASGVKNQGYAAQWIADCLQKLCKYKEAYIFYKKAKIIWDQRAPVLSLAIHEILTALEGSQNLDNVLGLGEKEILQRCSAWINEL